MTYGTKVPKIVLLNEFGTWLCHDMCGKYRGKHLPSLVISSLFVTILFTSFRSPTLVSLN